MKPEEGRGQSLCVCWIERGAYKSLGLAVHGLIETHYRHGAELTMEIVDTGTG